MISFPVPNPAGPPFSLTVAAKSKDAARRTAANKILHKIREHSDNLVNQVRTKVYHGFSCSWQIVYCILDEVKKVIEDEKSRKGLKDT